MRRKGLRIATIVMLTAVLLLQRMPLPSFCKDAMPAFADETDLVVQVMECYSAIKENEILPPPKKDVLFIIGDWNAKVGSQEIPRCVSVKATQFLPNLLPFLPQASSLAGPGSRGFHLVLRPRPKGSGRTSALVPVDAETVSWR